MGVCPDCRARIAIGGTGLSYVFTCQSCGWNARARAGAALATGLLFAVLLVMPFAYVVLAGQWRRLLFGGAVSLAMVGILCLGSRAGSRWGLPRVKVGASRLKSTADHVTGVAGGFSSRAEREELIPNAKELERSTDLSRLIALRRVPREVVVPRSVRFAFFEVCAMAVAAFVLLAWRGMPAVAQTALMIGIFIAVAVLMYSNDVDEFPKRDLIANGRDTVGRVIDYRHNLRRQSIPITCIVYEFADSAGRLHLGCGWDRGDTLREGATVVIYFDVADAARNVAAECSRIRVSG